mgnify:CR=1 FL=1
MGIYFNPSNESYKRARNSQIFIDKTGLLEILNKRISTENNCIALSHARRFGKSHAAGMIDAYYSRGCDSSNLFADTKISESDDYRKYMNRYNVIHLKDDALTALIHLGYLGYDSEKRKHLFQTMKLQLLLMQP